MIKKTLIKCGLILVLVFNLGICFAKNNELSQISTVSISETRVIDGSILGFAVSKSSQLKPSYLNATDGKPDLIYLPRIKNIQDANIRTTKNKLQIVKTYYGNKQFKARLISKIIDRNLVLQAIRLENGQIWALQREAIIEQDSNLPVKADLNEAVVFSHVVLEPTINTFNSFCDAPGGAPTGYKFPGRAEPLNVLFVVRVSGREYPCMGRMELPEKDTYWRHYIGDDVVSYHDLRGGVFVQTQRLAAIIHLNASADYTKPVTMLRPDVMLLDSDALLAFRKKMFSEIKSRQNRYSTCLDNLHTKPHSEKGKAYAAIEHQTCGEEPDPMAMEDIDRSFIDTFVPKVWRKLWQH